MTATYGKSGQREVDEALRAIENLYTTPGPSLQQRLINLEQVRSVLTDRIRTTKEYIVEERQ